MVDVICTPVPDTSAPVISAPEADTPAAKHGSSMTADKTAAVIFCLTVAFYYLLLFFST